MARRAIATAAAVLLAAAPGAPFASALTFDATAAKNRPVSKVITLLKDMNKQLAKEAEEDEEIYDKMACWCETNDKEKTKSIAEAGSRIKDLTTKVEELTALSAQLGTEIKIHEKELAENQEALDKATAIREKQLAEFNAEEKDLLSSISALKSALVVLGKHNGGGESFLQLPSVHAKAIAATLKRALDRHSGLLRSALTPSQRRTALSFLQAPQDYFDAEPTFKQSYAPQSGEIFGILGQMKETFEANLAASQKEETENQKAFEDLKAAKEEEITAGRDQIEKKQEQLADTDEKNAQAKTDIEDTKESLAADEEFLGMLKEKCSMTDSEWEERQKTRQLEMEAVSKALAILSGDDAHDLFTKTFNFVQVSSSAVLARREAAARVLKAAADRFHSPNLAALSYRVKLDAFERVKEAIDELITQLGKDKAAEIKHKDFCVDEFNTNKLQTEKKEREKKDLVAKVEDLEGQVKALTEAVEALKAEIAEMQVQLKRAGEDREKQNQEFQQTVSDQRETKKLLQAALTVLEDFYGDAKAPATALAQQRAEPAGPPPPAGFEAYKKNAQSGGVMGMIEQIIADAKAMEGEAIRAEEDAQKAYEDFVKETNASIETKSKDIVNKSDAKAKAEAELVDVQEAKEAALQELEHLANYKAELHQECDFILKNFDLRQTARDEEVEALRQAKAILSGAK